jgi:diaminohydroxyphosphoribosylaminopyrimidine deaminase/5-amino-6-(5-phosphoribosylamino)uracil reductase
VVVSQPTDAESRQRVDILRLKGAEIIEVAPDADARAATLAALQELGKLGVLSVFVEGGAHTHGQFVDSGLADRVCAFIAPKIVGGVDARGAVGGVGAERLDNALKMIPGSARMRQVGEDCLIEGALSEWGAL